MKTEIEKIYCISLATSSRKPYVNSSYDCEVISAVDARNNPDVCKEYGLSVCPLNDSFKLLFDISPGAIGCFLSHYKIWHKMVNEKISHALILEDDVHSLHVNNFLNMGFSDYKNYELVQLTKRFHYCTSQGIVKSSSKENDVHIEFNGTESFILSNEGAKKLIEATHDSSLLKDIIYHDFLNVDRFFKTNNLTKLTPSYGKMSITAPVDKHIVLCCHPKAKEKIRLNFFHLPCVGLDAKKSNESEICVSTPPWLMNQQQLQAYYSLKMSH